MDNIKTKQQFNMPIQYKPCVYCEVITGYGCHLCKQYVCNGSGCEDGRLDKDNSCYGCNRRILLECSVEILPSDVESDSD